MSENNTVKKINVALAGSPNCGKTTIFNGLTGSNQEVGNYTGVTVEKREGYYTHNGVEYNIQDLPGTYSLTSYSPEETVTQNELINNQPDVVTVVVDETALARSLVLLVQIMLNNKKVVLCLNMSDEAKKTGQRVNLEKFQELLGFPVIETIGNRKTGLDELKEKIAEAAMAKPLKSRLMLGELLDEAIKEIVESLKNVTFKIPEESKKWYALKLLQDDNLFIDKILTDKENGQNILDLAVKLRNNIETLTHHDISLYIMERYYGFIDGLLREVVIHKPVVDTRAMSDKIDSFLVHPIMGLPIFFGIMYSIFWITFTVGAYPMDWIDSGLAMLSRLLSQTVLSSSPPEIKSLVINGIIGGVGGVLVFLPNIIILFMGLAILQDTGYMSRAAFLTDSMMHKFGLHGRSFVPMLMGFGCTVPAIMATRTIENRRDRLTTIMILPLMSCSARLVIWLLLIPAFFPPWIQPMVLFSIYFTGILIALLLARLLRNTLFKGEEAPFVMELPPYRMPTMISVLNRIKRTSWLYIQKAGTIILGISIVMWALTSYPKYNENSSIEITAGQKLSPELIKQKQLENSIAGKIGKFIEPVIKPLGFDWKIGVATISAFTAKEVFVSQMGVIFAVEHSDQNSLGLREKIKKYYSPLTGISLILFLLISSPCMATIAVTKQETGSWKWAALQLFGFTILGYVISLIVYQVGSILVS
ncbi:MAG: ferrous iron transport protein B [Deltaproteobacteria bacterium]|nr:ferrous iron transport protein B [Deltaproteobacteria bacterium]